MYMCVASFDCDRSSLRACHKHECTHAHTQTDKHLCNKQHQPKHNNVATINWNESHQKATHFINERLPGSQPASQAVRQACCVATGRAKHCKRLQNNVHIFLGYNNCRLATDCGEKCMQHMLLAYRKISHNNNGTVVKQANLSANHRATSIILRASHNYAFTERE